jgi:hypothetical protein
MGRPKLLDTLTIRRFVNTNRPIIYGTMLGDASIINRGSHATLSISHAEDQKALVFHKWNLFREVAPTPPRSYPCEKWGQPKWYFHTACDVEWQKIWSIFHQNCRTAVFNGRKVCYKVVTPQILREVDDGGLALWVMDDGSYTYGHQTHNVGKPLNFFRLHTEGYTFAENRLVAEWFRERYGVSVTILRSFKHLKDGTPREYFNIRIGWKEYERIVAKIEPYVIPEMRHKLGYGPPRTMGGSIVEPKTRSGLTGNRESQLETAGRPHEAGQ